VLALPLLLLPPVEDVVNPPAPPVTPDDPPLPEDALLALEDELVVPEPHAGVETTTPRATPRPRREPEYFIIAISERTRSTRRAITGKSRLP
jgi:hypothetical protein